MRLFLLFYFILITSFTQAQCWSKIATGHAHVIAVANDGSLWTWGNNGNGQLGDNTSINKSVPTRIGNSNDWADVYTGYYQSFAIKTDGSLWAWGLNDNNQLGLGSAYTTVYSPTRVGNDLNWKSVSGGYNHALALKTDGTLWVTGKNLSGQLGINYTQNFLTTSFTQIGSSTNWVSIEAGSSFSFAINALGELWGWGWNYYGNLGNGSNGVDVYLPVKIGTDSNWRQVAAGSDFSIAIKTNGTIYSTGRNNNSQLGKSYFGGFENTFTQIGTDTNWDKVSCGYWHSIATKTDNTMYSWGYNVFAQLGDDTTSNRMSPVQIGNSITTWSNIYTGEYFSVSLTTDNVFYGWGYGGHGMNGNGNTSQSYRVPTSNTCPTVLSSENFSNDKFELFPNPVNDVLNIQSTEEIETVEIFSLTGQKINSFKGINRIETSNLSSGIYLVQIMTVSGTKSIKKIVKD